MKSFLSFSGLLATFVATTAFAQGPAPSPNIHRSLSALEAELLAIVDRKEEILNAMEQRNVQINQLTLERNRAQGADRDRLSQRIETNNNQNRAASIESGRLELNAERIRIEIDRLMRFDDLLAAGAQGAPKAPPIRAINIVKRDRKGPMQVPGQGRGFQEMTLYDVIFADGSRQRVESTNFIPQK